MRMLLLAVVAGLGLAEGRASAQPLVESLDPPAFERGKTTRVRLVGKGLDGADALWHSGPAGAFTTRVVSQSQNQTVFDVTVARDAPVGLFGVRVAGRDGLGNMTIALIDDLPHRVASSEPLPLPATVVGTFRTPAIHRYRIEVTAGQRLSFEVVANRFGKDVDPMITITDAAGRLITESDNLEGLYFDTRFEQLFPKTGIYEVAVRDARYRSNEHYHYALRIGRFPATQVALPAATATGPVRLTLPECDTTVESVVTGSVGQTVNAMVRRPGDDGSSWLPIMITDQPTVVVDRTRFADRQAWQAATSPAMTLLGALSPLRSNPFLGLDRSLRTGRLHATPAQVPGVWSGVLREPDEVHALSFTLEKGASIYLRGETRSLNSPVDLSMVLVDARGRELRRGNENRDDVTLDFTAPTTGEYGVIVRDTLQSGTPTATYRITARSTPFPLSIQADCEGLTIPQGSYQAIPFVLSRADHPEPIPLTLIGAPPEMRLEPSVIPPKSSWFVSRLVCDTAVPLGLQTVQIEATIKGERVLVTTQPLIDKKLVNVDLIPIALRDDQRRLPPSLTDRLAVQVTPPSPYTFELGASQLTLPRYQAVEVPIVTTRSAGFTAPISFSAVGGQLADKNEGRTRVYAEFPRATPAELKPRGRVVSKILSNTTKSRIDVTALGRVGDREIRLTRCFDLDLRPAFQVTSQPMPTVLLPGESARYQVSVDRLPSFRGPITLKINVPPGMNLPEQIEIPANATSKEIPVRIDSNETPRRFNVSFTATAVVDGYEEEVRGNLGDLEIRKVEAPAKPSPAPGKRP